MVYLGFMLPTDKEHEEKIKNLSELRDVSIETYLNDLIDEDFKNRGVY